MNLGRGHVGGRLIVRRKSIVVGASGNRHTPASLLADGRQLCNSSICLSSADQMGPDTAAAARPDQSPASSSVSYAVPGMRPRGSGLRVSPALPHLLKRFVYDEIRWRHSGGCIVVRSRSLAVQHPCKLLKPIQVGFRIAPVCYDMLRVRKSGTD